MWINVREGSYGHTRGRDAHENETLSCFVRSVFGGCLLLFLHCGLTEPSSDKMFHMLTAESGSWATRYPEGWYCDLFFKKKSVTRLLVDLENHGLDVDLVLVKDYFDGGETVYFKLFDEEGEQRSQVPFG